MQLIVCVVSNHDILSNYRGNKVLIENKTFIQYPTADRVLGLS